MKFNKLGTAALALAGSITSIQAMMQGDVEGVKYAHSIAVASIAWEAAIPLRPLTSLHTHKAGSYHTEYPTKRF